MYQTIITVVGLGLDILGACLIAIPDVRVLFSRLTPGALQEARGRMVLVGTQEGDTGFELLKDLLEDVNSVAEFGTEHGDDQYTEIVINSLSGMQTPETQQHREFEWGNRYVEARYEQGGDWDDTDFYDVNDVFDAIAAKERPQVAQLRLYGLLALFCGFTLQLLATINAHPVFPVLIGIVTLGIASLFYIYGGELE